MGTCPACNRTAQECRCFELDAVETVRQQIDAIKQCDETIRQLRAMVGELCEEVKSWTGLRLDRLMAGDHLNAEERKAVRLYREESLALLAHLEERE